MKRITTLLIVGCLALLLAASICSAQMYTAIDLGTLPGDLYSQGLAVNIFDQVVGDSLDPLGQSRAFLWTKKEGVQSLGTLPSGGESHARGINNFGQVVGFTYNGQAHAFLWTEGEGMQDLGTLPGYLSRQASGINDFGQVVGSCFSYNVNVPPHAFLWTKAEGMQDLGTLPGGTQSVATAINDFSQVIPPYHLWVTVHSCGHKAEACRIWVIVSAALSLTGEA